MFAHIISNGINQRYSKIPISFAGVEDFGSLTDTQRAVYGFLPIINVTPNYDTTYEKGSGQPTYTIFPDRVELLYVVTSIILADARRIKLAQIEDRKQRILDAGVTLGGRVWLATAEERNALTSIAVVANSVGLPPLFVWRDSTNASVSLTLPQLTTLLQTITTLLFNTYEMAARKRDQVAATTTVEQVKNINA